MSVHCLQASKHFFPAINTIKYRWTIFHTAVICGMPPRLIQLAKSATTMAFNQRKTSIHNAPANSQCSRGDGLKSHQFSCTCNTNLLRLPPHFNKLSVFMIFLKEAVQEKKLHWEAPYYTKFSFKETESSTIVWETYTKRANQEYTFTSRYPRQRVYSLSSWSKEKQKTKKVLKITNFLILSWSTKVDVPMNLVPRYHHKIPRY